MYCLRCSYLKVAVLAQVSRQQKFCEKEFLNCLGVMNRDYLTGYHLPACAELQFRYTHPDICKISYIEVASKP